MHAHPASDLLFVIADHANDLWTNTDGKTEPRPYHIWLHDVSPHPAGGHTLTLFISTQDIPDAAPSAATHRSVVDYPGVRSGRLLHGPMDSSRGTRPEVRLATISVEVSGDNGLSWHQLRAPDSSGRYTIAQFVGLDSGEVVALAVRLTVNGKTLTTSRGDVPRLQFPVP